MNNVVLPSDERRKEGLHTNPQHRLTRMATVAHLCMTQSGRLCCLDFATQPILVRTTTVYARELKKGLARATQEAPARGSAVPANISGYEKGWLFQAFADHLLNHFASN